MTHVPATDGRTGASLQVDAKGFLRGALLGNDPTVALVVRSDDDEVLAVLELNSVNAHVISERIRQEAELVSVIEKEKEEEIF